MSGPKRLATIVLAASMALSISGCASTYTGGTGDVARLEALAAAERGDLGPLERLVETLGAPWDDTRVPLEFRHPAEPGKPPYRTFCGT